MTETARDNLRTLSGVADANIETGVLLLCKEFLVTAITDRRLDRTHLRVLACMVNFVNRKTAKAWPDRRKIAEALGVEPVTVSNKLRELRVWGYLIAERERVAEANNRSLMVYTFGNVDHDTIRSEIDAYVARIKDMADRRVTEGGDFANQKSPQAVTSKSPVTVTVTECGDSRGPKVTEYGARKSPSTVDSNSEKELLPSNVEKLTTVGTSPSVRSADEGEAALEKRGTRLPENWMLSRDLGNWTIEHFVVPSADDVRAEAEKFKNHWLSESGPSARKRDWGRAWQKWCDGVRHWKRRRVDRSIAPDLAEPTTTGGAPKSATLRQIEELVGARR